MPNLCPCKRCRPPGQSLKQAKKLCVDVAMIRRYGVVGYEAHKIAERERLEALRKEKRS